MFREDGKTKIGGDMSTKNKYYISPINTKDKSEFLHSTIKPSNFVKNHIINSSNEGDIVLDPFMGSGTTALVCKEINRNFIGFEIEQKWVDIANDRLNGINAHGQISMFLK
jgi:DNA modification methylase